MSTFEARRNSSKHRYPGIFCFENGILKNAELKTNYPWRVKNRFFLHELGACGMATTIIQPNQEINCTLLRKIAEVSSDVNSDIGLDVDVNNLFIRTRDSVETARMLGINPVLIIEKINKWFPKMYTFDDDNKLKRVWFLNWWRKTMSPIPMYLMVHEENAKAQKKAIHGRVMRKVHDGNWELSLGTNVMHAREIGKNDSKYISMHGHSLEWMVENIAYGNMFSKLTCSSPEDAVKLASGMLGYLEDLQEVIEYLERRGIYNAVLEFRNYGLRDNGDSGMHIYDLDTKF